MSRILVTSLSEEYFNQLSKRGVFRHYPNDGGVTRDFILNKSTSVCVLLDGDPQGCGGVVTLWPGVGDVWASVTPQLQDHPLLLVRATLGIIARIQKAGNFHRLQMNIPQERSDLCKWAETLGFTSEGLMLQYGADKKHHIRYARIWD